MHGPVHSLATRPLMSSPINAASTDNVTSDSLSSSSLSRRVTDCSEIERVIDWVTAQGGAYRKLRTNLREWLEYGSCAGDQGLAEPATPVLYVNHPEPLRCAVLIFGNGCIEHVLKELHAQAETETTDATSAQVVPAPSSAADIATATAAVSPSSAGTAASDSVSDDSWKRLPTSFYCSFATDGSAVGDEIVARMLRELLPLRARKCQFFFSAIHQRFKGMVVELAGAGCVPAATDPSASPPATVSLHPFRIDWNPASLWELLRPESRPPLKDAEHLEALDRCRRRFDELSATEALEAATTAAAAAAASSPSSSACAAATTVPSIEVGPLREEHVDLVVSQWPWASPSAPALIRSLIRDLITRCVFVQGVPACWCLQTRYGVLGMLHTQEPYRSRGLASLCIESFVSAILHKEPTLSPYAVITDGNLASERTFTKRGWEMTHPLMWVLLSRT